MEIPECYYRISVKGIAVDAAGRFLLAREVDGKWDMLGGGLEHGEAPLDGLRREVQEEAGLAITAVSPTPHYFVTALRPGHATYMASIVYQMELASLDFTPSDECQELRFVTPEEASQLDLLPSVQKLLEVFDPALHRKP